MPYGYVKLSKCSAGGHVIRQCNTKRHSSPENGDNFWGRVRLGSKLAENMSVVNLFTFILYYIFLTNYKKVGHRQGN